MSVTVKLLLLPMKYIDLIAVAITLLLFMMRALRVSRISELYEKSCRNGKCNSVMATAMWCIRDLVIMQCYY